MDSKCSRRDWLQCGILRTCFYGIVRAGGGLSRAKLSGPEMLAVVGQAWHLEDGPGRCL